MIAEFGVSAEYFISPPNAAEIDDSGLLRKETLAAMDDMLREQLRKKLADYEPDGLGIGTNPNNRWRTASCMQKAIRFRDVEMARFAATAAHDMDSAYVLRRLGVTAVEDVGAGSIWGMCAALAALGNRAWRQEVGEKKLVAWLAEHLAKAAKDRTLCELVCMADFDRLVPKDEWASMPDEALLKVVRDPGMPIEERAIAAWLAAGTKRFEGMTMPKDNARSVVPLLRAMHETGLPRALLYVAMRTASRLNEILFAMVPFMHEALVAQAKSGQPPVLIPGELPQGPMPKVGLLLGAAYDMHTREGRIALRKFELECPAVGEFRHMLGDRTFEETLLGFGVFCAEGGVLETRVGYADSEQWRALAHRLELSFPGLPEEQHAPFLKAIRENLPQLNEIRERVLWATKHR